MDTYLTLQSSSETQLTEKRSRFLAFAMHVDSEQEAKEMVALYKKEYYDARHVCYAYVVGNQGEVTRANDDGEPSGTARSLLVNISLFNSFSIEHSVKMEQIVNDDIK